MGGDGDLEPGPVEGRGQNEVGCRRLEFSEQGLKALPALRGALLEGIKMGDLPFKGGRKPSLTTMTCLALGQCSMKADTVGVNRIRSPIVSGRK